MIRAAIIEDSRLARLELKEQLTAYPTIEVVGEADSFESGMRLIKETDPDLIFLDIHLPGKTGFELLENLDMVPAVLFTTAFDQYALQSFEYNTIDYLLKPIAPERLRKAIDKVENLLRNSLQVRTTLRPGHQRIFVKDGEKCWFISISAISHLESKGNYTQIFFEENAPMILKSLQHLENILDPLMFIRINRQQMVNVNYIQKVVEWFGGRLKLTMKSGATLEVSRRQVGRMREVFGI